MNSGSTTQSERTACQLALGFEIAGPPNDGNAESGVTRRTSPGSNVSGLNVKSKQTLSIES